MFLVIFAMFLNKKVSTMTLDILICTIDEGIKNIPKILIPKEECIRYTISMQYTDESYFAMIPDILRTRDDITLTMLQGKGLSRNRNNAIAHAKGDILLMADDDNRYTSEQLHTIIDTHTYETEADVILFRSNLNKYFPDKVESYQKAFTNGYYPSSVEMTFKNKIGITFNERFGLGSGMFCAGEESIFIKDCIDDGLNVILVPQTIVETPAITSSSNFAKRTDLQIAKGAMFCYLFGRKEAIWRSFKEAMYHFLHRFANPFTIFHYMMKGIRTL